MKIKLDENLPLRLSVALRKLGHDAHTVFDENLGGCSDREIWEASVREARFLITQDLDFSDVRQFRPRTHQGILLVRLQSASRQGLINRVVEIFETEKVIEWQSCFVVATERKVRILRPPNK
jgi:predicted nuclease of predicted toxin-antitoxin system